MKLFKSECLYDPETLQWLEKFWVDGKETDGDTYFSLMEQETYIEDMRLEEEENKVVVSEDEGISYDELLDIFVEKIVNTQGCPGCVREVLDEFADVLLEDECNDEFDNDEFEENCVECDCIECKEDRFFHLVADTLNDIQEVDEFEHEELMEILMRYTMEFQDIGIRIVKKEE